MSFTSTLNKISRIHNKFLLVGISILILVLLIIAEFDLNGKDSPRITIIVLWSIFALISILYTINGVLISNGFNAEMYKFQKAGKPLKGVRGYTELMEGLNAAKTTSIAISVGAILSLIVFIVSLQNLGDINPIVVTSLAFTMVFLSISVVFLVQYPEGTALDAGSLVSFYEPDAFPMTLDNILSDVFLTYLDPITFMAMDDWTSTLSGLLDENYESDENQVTRVERAREKVLLVAYLANSIPETVTEDVVNSEIAELIGINNLDRFMSGVDTGITWDELTSIMEIIEKETPEAFRLVDRLLINLMDNYEEFISKDIYFTISALTNQGSIAESSGALVFFLNNTKNENRKMKIEFRSDRDSIHPEYQKINITLDPLTDPYPEERPDFIADGDDILSLLSSLLQVGDAVWLRFKPAGFGFKVVTIQAEEEGTSNVFGQSIEMKFTKSIGWYVKTFAPKLSALGGVAMPVLLSVVVL